MKDWRPLAFAVAIAASFVWWFSTRPIHHPPGVIAPDIPLQVDVDGDAPTLQKGDIAITPLAKFTITARVLSRADYRWDAGAALSPIDLALGWGRMSDSSILEKVDISQSARFYFWKVTEFPIPQQEIIESSANMHLVPADDTVKHEMQRTREGDVVTFDGYLIEAKWPDGRKWRSSLTRSDTGAGACELVWVQSFAISRH